MSDLEVRRGSTYRSFDEVKETLSPREERFERLRRTVGLGAGPLLGVLTYFLASGLAENQQRLAGILIFVVVYWITEAIPIPVTAVLGLCLAVLLGVESGDEIGRAHV